MLMAHPAVLRNLIGEYETLCALDTSEGSSARARQRLDDVTYTLCVSTGTRNVDEALAAARRQLAKAAGGAGSLC